MPITKQASKKLRHDRIRSQQIEATKRTLRKIIKTTRARPSKTSLAKVFSELDKAAKHHVIHKNKAARLKSHLSKLLKK